MQVPGSIAAIRYYKEIAQWALKNVVCGRVASIIGVLALTSDANWSCLIVDVVVWTVVQYHVVLSLFACEWILGLNLLLLSHPSVGSVANMLFPFCVSGKHG